MQPKKDERFWGDIGPWLINSSEVGSHKSECSDFNGENYGVENERSDKLAGGLALGIGKVGPEEMV